MATMRKILSILASIFAAVVDEDMVVVERQPGSKETGRRESTIFEDFLKRNKKERKGVGGGNFVYIQQSQNELPRLSPAYERWEHDSIQ